jgi:hypothetical protein
MKLLVGLRFGRLFGGVIVDFNAAGGWELVWSVPLFVAVHLW